jgi:hypothetical protein
MKQRYRPMRQVGIIVWNVGMGAINFDRFPPADLKRKFIEERDTTHQRKQFVIAIWSFSADMQKKIDFSR